MGKVLIYRDLYDKSGGFRGEVLVFDQSSSRVPDSALGSPEIAP